MKLHQLMLSGMDPDIDSSEGRGDRDEVSPSTVQMMFNTFLYARGGFLSLATRDHNACPSCIRWKALILRFDYEKKKLLASRPVDTLAVAAKGLELSSEVDAMLIHTEQEAAIRRQMKHLSDYFRLLENRAREEVAHYNVFRGSAWLSRGLQGRVGHQDDKSKSNVPHVAIDSLAALERIRLNLSGHVSLVDDSADMFTHELGANGKDSGAIFEASLLSMLLDCKGEGIFVEVSDCAAAGRSFRSAVSFVEFIVANKFAHVGVKAYLQNRHSKYRADVFFGLAELAFAKGDFTGADSLMKIAESVSRGDGVPSAQAYVINPLSSVDWDRVLADLGYQIKPDAGLDFTERNIHFAVSCTAEGRNLVRNDPKLKDLLFDLLPESDGMVRLTSHIPLPGVEPSSLPLHQRPIDVPACGVKVLADRVVPHDPVVNGDVNDEGEGDCDYGSVPKLGGDRSPSSALVPPSTAEKVGHNGYTLLKSRVDLVGDTGRKLHRESWPEGYKEGLRDEQGKLLVAPANFIFRLPVHHFDEKEFNPGWAARYPFLCLVNSQKKRHPRDTDGVTFKATYSEPPAPIIPGVASEPAMRLLNEKFGADLSIRPTFLDLLQCVFESMGRKREDLDVASKHLLMGPRTPCTTAVEEYVRTICLTKELNKNRPKSPQSLYQRFKSSTEGKAMVQAEKDNFDARRAGAAGGSSGLVPPVFDKVASFKKMFNGLRESANGRELANKLDAELEAASDVYARDMVKYTKGSQAVSRMPSLAEDAHRQSHNIVDWADKNFEVSFWEDAF